MDKDISYVLSVARCGSISKAAAALYVSQPSLSHYITKLENRLGIALFKRTLDGVIPTEAGLEYLAYAEQIHSLYSEMNDRMQQLSGASQAQINVCLPLSMNLNIAEIQRRFYDKYPQYHLNISCMKAHAAYEKVKTKSCSFAVGPKPPEEMQLQFDKFHDTVLLMAVPLTYDFSLLETRIPGIEYPAIDPRKLPEIQVVLQADTTNTRRRINKIAEQYGLKLVPVLEVESTLTAIISARQQMGCCFFGQGYRNFVQPDDPLKLYVLDAGNGDIIHGERGIIYLPGKQFSVPERFVYQLAADSMVQNQ